MADKVLVLGDAHARDELGAHFERAGYKVWREDADEHALESYRRDRQDVVLLDLHLPDGKGLGLLERLRHLGAAVVLLAGQNAAISAVQAMQLGAENFLTKPVDMNHLTAVVARAVEKARLSRENSRLRALLEQVPELRQRSPVDRRYQAQSLSEVERQHIERTLRHHGGNRTRAALELGISRATLINKIKAYRLAI
ncbi:MAG TPA: response regulator [Gemmatimonadales bacterium]|nr:response regulator [Gemmatimonadales bacterium]